METVLNASHERIVRDYLSEFLDEYHRPTYRRVSLILAGYPRRRASIRKRAYERLS